MSWAEAFAIVGGSWAFAYVALGMIRARFRLEAELWDVSEQTQSDEKENGS